MSYKVVTTATTFYASRAGITTYSDSTGGISSTSLSLPGAVGNLQSINQSITLKTGYNWSLNGPLSLDENSVIRVEGTSTLKIT